MRLRRKPPKGNVRRVAPIDRNLREVITNKIGQSVQIESFNERILTVQFDRDPTVKDYRSQPFTINYTDKDKKRRKYTPDFLVLRNNNHIELHEVTISERRKLSHSRERETAAKKVCKEKGWKYVVHTEQTLPQETEITNLLALLPYRLKKYAHEGVAKALHEHLAQTISGSLCDCSKNIAHRLNLPESVVFGAFCHLLWTGEMSADLRSVLLIIDCTFNVAAKIQLPKRKGRNNIGSQSLTRGDSCRD